MKAEAMAALHARAFARQGRAWRAEEFEELLSSPHVFFCEAPHGFALGRVLVDEAELLTIAVDPEQRRAGVGAGLLASFEAEAVRHGVARSVLEVAEDNAAARALYRGAGYVQIACRKGYYGRAAGSPVAALILGKPL